VTPRLPTLDDYDGTLGDDDPADHLWNDDYTDPPTYKDIEPEQETE